MNKQELIEQLADKEHDSWARWMQYLFSKSWKDGNGCMVIPEALVDRWSRQADTPYAQLTEQEKQSDRDEVAQILPIIEEYASQEALTKGVMTINEARSMKGLPPANPDLAERSI